mmetsp:Transcript_11249/g.24357  ORF Transcript_11249/g.24357 Transcript_11249/m.24357 type:complete len:220 (-) Transcript_11249:279-938(-)
MDGPAIPRGDVYDHRGRDERFRRGGSVVRRAVGIEPDVRTVEDDGGRRRGRRPAGGPGSTGRPDLLLPDAVAGDTARERRPGRGLGELREDGRGAAGHAHGDNQRGVGQGEGGVLPGGVLPQVGGDGGSILQEVRERILPEAVLGQGGVRVAVQGVSGAVAGGVGGRGAGEGRERGSRVRAGGRVGEEAIVRRGRFDAGECESTQKIKIVPVSTYLDRA